MKQSKNSNCFKYFILYVLIMAFLYFAYKTTDIVSKDPSILDGIQNWQLYFVVATVLATIFKAFIVIGWIIGVVYIILFLYSIFA